MKARKVGRALRTEPRQARSLASGMTWLRHYGVDWDADRLEAFARMLYVQSDSAMTLAGRLPPAQAHWVMRWNRRQAVSLLRTCFPRRPPQKAEPFSQGQNPSVSKYDAARSRADKSNPKPKKGK